MLKMKSKCEACETRLELTDEAFICSYECTFCPECTVNFDHICPNCEGELTKRPTRVKGVVAAAAGQLKRRLFGS